MGFIRAQMPGRLLCDTFLSARELLKENDYSLTNLAQNQLEFKRKTIEIDAIIKFFEDQNDVIELIQHNSDDTVLISKLMFNL